jgi:chromate transporter
VSPILYFWTFLKASLFSSGGTGNMPSLHNDLTAAHLATGRQFAEALLIGQISPGPTGLWSISLGYLTHGLFGSLAATIALAIPPFLVLLVDRLYRRVEHHRAVEGFVRGLSLAIVGIYVVILLRLLGGVATDYRTDLIAIAAFALGFQRRAPVLAVLAAAGIAGVVIYRF